MSNGILQGKFIIFKHWDDNGMMRGEGIGFSNSFLVALSELVFSRKFRTAFKIEGMRECAFTTFRNGLDTSGFAFKIQSYIATS